MLHRSDEKQVVCRNDEFEFFCVLRGRWRRVKPFMPGVDCLAGQNASPVDGPDRKWEQHPPSIAGFWPSSQIHLNRTRTSEWAEFRSPLHSDLPWGLLLIKIGELGGHAGRRNCATFWISLGCVAIVFGTPIAVESCVLEF